MDVWLRPLHQYVAFACAPKCETDYNAFPATTELCDHFGMKTGASDAVSENMENTLCLTLWNRSINLGAKVRNKNTSEQTLQHTVHKIKVKSLDRRHLWAAHWQCVRRREFSHWLCVSTRILSIQSTGKSELLNLHTICWDRMGHWNVNTRNSQAINWNELPSAVQRLVWIVTQLIMHCNKDNQYTNALFRM